MSKNVAEQNNNEAQELLIQAKALSDMADDWVAMGSELISIDDVRHRAARLRQKAKNLPSEEK